MNFANIILLIALAIIAVCSTVTEAVPRHPDAPFGTKRPFTLPPQKPALPTFGNPRRF